MQIDLAKASSINVVHNVRQADMDAGGQGAPLAPIYHAACAACRLICQLSCQYRRCCQPHFVSADDPHEFDWV